MYLLSPSCDGLEPKAVQDRSNGEQSRARQKPPYSGQSSSFARSIYGRAVLRRRPDFTLHPNALLQSLTLQPTQTSMNAT
jgi:hypothetical protein